MERVVLQKVVCVVVGVAAAVGLWLVWVHFANMVAYRAPYGLWQCQIDNGGVIGNPFVTIAGIGLRLMLLPVSFAVVTFVATGLRLRGRRRWLCLILAVVAILLITWGYVAAVDATLYPTYAVPECS